MLPLLATTLAVTLTMTSLVVPAASAMSSKRVLVVVSAPDDPKLAAQIERLEAVKPKELAERDLVVLHVLPKGEIRILFGDRNAAVPSGIGRPEDGSTFSVRLIGKDGGVKWQDDRPVRPETLFELIDSMPMRALEMKRNGPAG